MVRLPLRCSCGRRCPWPSGREDPTSPLEEPHQGRVGGGLTQGAWGWQGRPSASLNAAWAAQRVCAFLLTDVQEIFFKSSQKQACAGERFINKETTQVLGRPGPGEPAVTSSVYLTIWSSLLVYALCWGPGEEA